MARIGRGTPQSTTRHGRTGWTHPKSLPITDLYANTSGIAPWRSSTSVTAEALRATAIDTDTVAGIGVYAADAIGTITVKTLTSGYAGVAGRIRNANQYLLGTVLSTGVVNIFRYNSGYTTLATATLSSLPAAPFELSFQAVGNILTLFIDGVPVLGAEDTVIPDPGDWGSYFYTYVSVALVEIDDFTVTDTTTPTTLPLTYAFADTNGDPWPAPWTTDGTGAADIQSNKGRLQADSGGYDYHWAVHTLASPTADMDFSGNVTIDSADEQYIRIFVGGENVAGNSIADGYCLQLYPSYGGWNLQRHSSYSGTDLTGTAVNLTMVANDVVRFRVQRIGTTIRAKVWLNGASEPSAWGASATDSTHTDGLYAGVLIQSGLAAIGNTALFDDLVFAEATTQTLDMYTYQSGSWVKIAGIYTYVGAAWVQAAGVATYTGATWSNVPES